MTLLRQLCSLATKSGLVLTVAVSTPALSQDTITVDGQRIETAEIRSTARDITVGSRATQAPLARYQRPFCPGVWGMTLGNAQAVLDRIVFNALEAGIAVAEDEGCGANAWLIVVDDAADTFERLHEDDSFLTRHLTRAQLRRIRDDGSDALAWNLITTRNPETGIVLPDGFQMAGLVAQAKADPQESGPQILANSQYEVPPNSLSFASRLELGVRSEIELSVVLVERSALGEIDSSALADYASMRLLAHTEPPGPENTVSTVLTLFSPGEQTSSFPQRMTAFDRAYLRALYRSSPTRPARIAIGNISGAMETIDTP